MWHEARKQEKKIREAVVDLQKRAERRRQHYAKQVGGRSHSHNDDATQSFCSHNDRLSVPLSSEARPDAADEGVREKDPASPQPSSQQEEQQHVRTKNKMKRFRKFRWK